MRDAFGIDGTLCILVGFLPASVYKELKVYFKKYILQPDDKING